MAISKKSVSALRVPQTGCIPPTKMFDYRDFVCGAASGSFSIVVTFPISKISFRQQLHGFKINRAYKEVYKEGLWTLYRGLLPPLLQRGLSLSLLYGMFESYSKLLTCNFLLSAALAKPLAGALAGATEAVVALPLERIQILLLDKSYHSQFKNTLHVFVHLRQFGFTEYYRGFIATLFRNSTTSAAFFTLREPISQYVQNVFGHLVKKPHSSEHNQDKRDIQLLGNFLSGSVLGVFLTTASFPMKVILVRTQSVLGGQFKGPLSVFWVIFRERDYSVRRLFRGVHISYTRSILFWGANNSAYELLKDLRS